MSALGETKIKLRDYDISHRHRDVPELDSTRTWSVPCGQVGCFSGVHINDVPMNIAWTVSRGSLNNRNECYSNSRVV